jgi:DNA-binding transcriptional ArsR family regulator
VTGPGPVDPAAQPADPAFPVAVPAVDARDGLLDDAVKAIGHPGRRAMLRLAREGERTSSELAQTAALSPSAASQHLKILRDAGLLLVRIDAQRRLYRVDPQRLSEVKALLEDLWTDRLGVLKEQAESAAARDRDGEGRARRRRTGRAG